MSVIVCLIWIKVPKFYWSQRGWPVRSDIQKDACEKIKFTPTIRSVADMHAISGYAGDDGPNSIYWWHQNFLFFLS